MKSDVNSIWLHLSQSKLRFQVDTHGLCSKWALLSHQMSEWWGPDLVSEHGCGFPFFSFVFLKANQPQGGAHRCPSFGLLPSLFPHDLFQTVSPERLLYEVSSVRALCPPQEE